ncbi:hypothetical protein H8S44_14880 [Anaerosacchariphilus sp. NSJ-68]|uniref:LPXTG cell wall anchor domain-containing protein n=2 Tax=Lachnospiraceae TaxID=186803 RepID=A0A923LEB5_9FIRM|nr:MULTISPECIES: hypothetical protein [Lachnospiraceae]MBC5661038.1 hypothetical protein [Anaerosacchariphilus hominis]MBC5699695.1 hypothetical protein [Roseburia difficilis]
MKAKTRKTISYVLASALILGGTFCTLSAKGLSAQAAGTTYRVLSGGDVNHPYGSSSGLDLLVEAPCEELTGILVNGQALDPSLYSTAAASNSSKPAKSDTAAPSQEPSATTVAPVETTPAPPATSGAPATSMPTSYSITDSERPIAQESFLQSFCTALKNAFTGITAEAASSRCTKVHIKADYLNSMPNGTHTVTLTYVNGQAVTTFSISDSPVVAQDAVPKTGVAQYSEIFGILAIAAGLAVIYFERKRRIHAE